MYQVIEVNGQRLQYSAYMLKDGLINVGRINAFREPSAPERNLLAVMAKLATEIDPRWVETITVRNMDDGGMESLELALPNEHATARRFGRRVAEYQFTDSDGVEVLVALNVDTEGRPFELDIWKTDFSPLVLTPLP